MKIPKEIAEALNVLRMYVDYELVRTFEVVLEKKFEQVEPKSDIEIQKEKIQESLDFIQKHGE